MANAANADTTFVSFKQVTRMLTLSRTAIMRRIKEGSFPAPVEIGGRAVRFRRSDIDTWVATLPPRDTTLPRGRGRPRKEPVGHAAEAKSPAVHW